MIDYSNIDYERRELMEENDYMNAVGLLGEIYSGYPVDLKCEKTEPWHWTDMNYTAETKSGEHLYNCEIKTRNQDMERYRTLPIKVRKFNKIVSSTEAGRKPLYLVFVNRNLYYLFDLSRLTASDMVRREIPINVTEYVLDKSRQVKEMTPLYLLDVSKAVSHGRWNYITYKAG